MSDRAQMSIDELETKQIKKIGGHESLAAAKTLTKDDNGKRFGLNLAGGFTVTLPAMADLIDGEDVIPFEVEFVVETAPTTAYIVATDAADVDTIVGSFTTATAHTTASDIETAGGDQVNFVASQAVIGDRIRLYTNGTNWFVSGHSSVPAGLTITG